MAPLDQSGTTRTPLLFFWGSSWSEMVVPAVSLVPSSCTHQGQGRAEAGAEQFQSHAVRGPVHAISSCAEEHCRMAES